MSLHAAANAIRQLGKDAGPLAPHVRTLEQAVLEIERRLAAIEREIQKRKPGSD